MPKNLWTRKKKTDLKSHWIRLMGPRHYTNESLGAHGHRKIEKGETLWFLVNLDKACSGLT